MGQNSAIEWCTHTHNPWVGCTKVSPACDHCYAESWAKRTGQAGLWAGERRRTSETNWRQPLKWNREAAVAGVRARVFCASLADVFDNQIPLEWRADLWRLIRETPSLDWLLLTKRPQNIAKMLPEDWGNGWPNVWLGTTVENQEEADRRIPHLLATPAPVRFLSCEPLLGPINLASFHIGWSECSECGHAHDPNEDYPLGEDRQCTQCDSWVEVAGHHLHWVICGGESGPHARPMHPDWARSLRDQCATAGVPYFFKQWGEYSPIYDRDIDDPDWRQCDQVKRTGNGRWLNLAGGHGFHGERVVYVNRVGKKAAGRLLDGRTHDAFPEFQQKQGDG